MSVKTRRLLRSRKFYGRLKWHVTPRRITFTYEGKSGSAPYRVLWKRPLRIAILIGQGSTSDLRDIHFDGLDHFYMLAGKANCEFFRRV
jgi:hypothetical protein